MDLCVGNHQGWDKADDVIVGAAGQQQQAELTARRQGAAGQCCIGRTVCVDEFDTDHQPHATHIADAGIVLLELTQLAFEDCTHGSGVLDQLLADDDLECRHRCGTGQCVAAVGTTVGAGVPFVHDLFAGHHGRQR